MCKTALFLGALWLLAASPCTASSGPDFIPGFWAVTSQTSLPGMRLPPATSRRCLGQDDPVPSPGSGRACTISGVTVSGNTVSWDVTCQVEGNQATGKGWTTYRRDSFEGAITLRSQGLDLFMSLNGKRLGACSCGPDCTHRQPGRFWVSSLIQRELPNLRAIMQQAVDWAEAQAARTAALGRPLTPDEAALARKTGVRHPERIRLLTVDSLPVPRKEPLRTYALASGLLGQSTSGLSFGYTVLIRRGHATCRVLSHEFRHVHQCEEHGSISAFLPAYLKQLAVFGYWNAPLEIDARRHEIKPKSHTDPGSDIL